MKSNKSVMIFGGSYNPIHQGHINAALSSSKQLNVDEVWLMPRKYNYDGSLLLNGKHRVKMIELAIEHLDNFKICNIELLDSKKELLYTYNTAVKLTKKYKDIDFYFLIGADQLNNFKRWYNSKKLSELFKLVCYKRPGYEIDLNIAKEYNVTIIDGPQVDTSSTLIRSGVFQKIDKDIRKYILDNQLYLKERVMPNLPEDRFIHVLTTARLAKRIAKQLNINTNQAYVAGILHDIAKGLTYDEIANIVKEHYPSKLKHPKYAYHAYASEYIAKNTYGITDKKILKAIRNHCRGTKKMSTLDKIIYCADKLEESRSFANRLNAVREMAFIDINKCFVMTLEEQVNFLKSRGEKFDPYILKLIEYYKVEVDDGR